jgi:mitochondrial fission protein ELM1
METIWIISDGLPGHYNQSIGLSNAIQPHYKYEVITVNIQLKYKGLRFLMRLIANYFPYFLGKNTFSFFYQHNDLPSKKPKIIISAGGNTIFANISLSRIHKANSIYSGTLKHYKSDLIDRVFTVTPLEGADNNVVLDLPPANINKPKQSKNEPYYTLLVGGDGAGYSYTDTDWKQLALAVIEIANRDSISWMITTSRRTGKDAEELLRANLDKHVIKEAIWFSSDPQRVVNKFVEEARVVFCTEDSLTMVSEAIYAHKPVITIQPPLMKPEKNDALALKKYQNKKFITRSSIADLTSQSIDKNSFCRNYPDIQAQILNSIESI